MTEFSITTQQYEEFNAHFTWMLVKVPTYRYGQAFINYFYPDAGEYLISTSHLGGNPGHAPNNSDILWNEKSYKKAKSMIEDFIEII
jgi:hypothetical protein